MRGQTGTDQLITDFRQGNVTALARAISVVENGDPGFEDLLTKLHPDVGSAYRIGITGPPGVGKSTLVERLVQHYRERDVRVAVVAVDPTSPFTGGALLGDRIRMESVVLDRGVFIRSMATRGAPGGLATTTREVCDVLDAFGFERIIIETVGVGQSELAIAGTADSTVLVLVPESGDGVQVLKAGVMEIADLYVVNKADRPGADRLASEVQGMLDIRAENSPSPGPSPDSGWNPPVVETVAIENRGVEPLVEAVERHAAHLRDTGSLIPRRKERLVRHIREVVDRSLRQRIWEESGGNERLADDVDRVVEGTLSPYDLAQSIISHRFPQNKG